MKNKVITLFFVCSLFTIPLFANLLENGDFNGNYETTFAGNTIKDGTDTVFYRLGSFFHESLQPSAPTPAEGSQFLLGNWYFKSPASGYFRALLEKEQNKDNSYSARIRVKKGSAQKNMEDITNLSLTRRISLTKKKYKITFDARRQDPSKEGQTENGSTAVYMFVTPLTAQTTKIDTEVRLEDDYNWHTYETYLDLTTSSASDWAFSIAIEAPYYDDNGTAKTKYASVAFDNIIIEENIDKPIIDNNLLKYGDFNGSYETVFIGNTVLDGLDTVFYRLANPFHESLQTGNPAPKEGDTFVKGNWYIKAPATYFFRLLLEKEEGKKDSYFARLRVNRGSAQKGMDDINTLFFTQRMNLGKKKYKVTFDARRQNPTRDKQDENGCEAVYAFLIPSTAQTTRIESRVALENDYDWHTYETYLDLSTSSATDWAFSMAMENQYYDDNGTPKTKYCSVAFDNIIVEEEGSMPGSEDVYNFDFEGETISHQWAVSQGVLNLTTEHFKSGQKSLDWTSSNDGSICTVSFLNSYEAGSNTCFFNIYNLTAIEGGLLEIEFLDAAEVVKKKAVITLDFKGWREFNRAYHEDFDNQTAASISSVRFRTVQTGGQTVKICLDNVNFKAATNPSRVYKDINWPDFKYLKNANNQMINNFYYSNNIDLALSTPTAKELADLEMIKSRYPREPKSASIVELRTIRPFVDALEITRNEDGSIKGGSFIEGEVTTDFLVDLTRKVEALAYSSKTSEADKKRFNDLLDLIIDQGLLFDASAISRSNYSGVRTMPKQWLNILPVCNEEQYEEVLRAANWMIDYGCVADPDYLLKLNTDYIYLFPEYLMTVATYQTDPAKAVQHTKAVKRYFERFTEPTPGGVDGIKVDGTGFHHWTHYNGYMYSFKTYAATIANLVGTDYQINKESFSNFRKAILAQYLMASRNVGGNYTANSLAGRHPLVGGNTVQFTQNEFKTLISTAEDVYGTPDKELQAAYAYFFLDEETYGVAASDLDGFYQFNYSPIGVYRHDTWTATMRTPTTRFWGAEIYSETNRFGRYQSHGTLEIVYNEKTPDKWGLPLIEKGWDWNVVPGATTVHFTNWKEMMPNGNVKDRFDQWSLTTDFSGALSFGKYGMYGAEFDQADSWGSQRFTPTNLTFKKSVYAFDGILISLGSNIGSVGSYADDRITATNLFQSIKPEVGEHGEFIVDGQIMKSGDAVILKNLGTNNSWLVTPEGTGYYVPKGNDKLVIKYGEQEGPYETGADYQNPSVSIAAKAYIEHGVKVSNKGYQFVVAPETTPAAMEALANRIGTDGGDLYKVEACNDKMHILTYKPQNITAYCFFEAASNVTAGKVKSVASEMLLMQKAEKDTRLSFAVTNPNLRPQDMGGYWKSTPTNTSVTIEGKWYPLGGTEDQKDVVVVQNADNTTTISFTIEDGFPIYFSVDVDPDAQGLSEDISENDIKVKTNSELGEINVSWGNDVNTKLVEVYSVSGKKLFSKTIEEGVTDSTFYLQNGSKGVYLINVITENKAIALKSIL